MPAAASAAPTLGKLAPPRVARAFARKRLFSQLDQSTRQPITWIAGPPGSGKTTLVSTWIATRKRAAVWIQLDAADADPATFFHYLSIGLSALIGRNRGRPLEFTPDDRRDPLGFARRYFRRASEAIDRPWALVLDNYQELADDSPLHASLAAVVDELPTGARWIAVSRTPPPAAYARARSTQSLALMDAQALKFSLDEATALAALHGATRSGAAIRRAADGWAAGMVLMLVAPDSDPDAVSASREAIFDYFAAEVLAKMAPAHQRALLCVAFLPSATEPMAIAVSGAPDAGRVLASLARRSLFTDRRHAGESVYVFHALFTAFLQARAAEAMTADELAAVRRRAAENLAAAGQTGPAIEQFLAAGAGDQAATLIDANAVAMFEQGRATTVADWLRRLPESIGAQPKLLYWRARAVLADDPPAANALFAQAFDAFERAGNPHGALLAAVGAAECIVYSGGSQIPLDPWLVAIERHVDVYLQSRDADTEALVLPAMLAAFAHRSPRHRLTLVLADRAAHMLDQPRFANHLGMLGSLSFVFTMCGDAARLETLRQRFEAMRLPSDRSPLAIAHWYVASIFFRAVSGDLAGARADAAEAIKFLDRSPNNPIKVRTMVRIAQGFTAGGDAINARRVLDAVAPLIGPDNCYDRSVLEHMRAIGALVDGDTANAVRHFETCLEAATQAGRPSGLGAMTGNAALAAVEHGDFERAEALLAQLRQMLDISPIFRFACGLIEARLADRRGSLAPCLAALRRAFAVTRETGIDFEAYIYVLGGMMSRLAGIALAHDIEPAVVRRMIRRHGIAAPSLDAIGWPWPIRIYTLGRFVVERDDEPLRASRKESKKVLELLKLVLAGGGAESPAKLMQALWPDAEGDHAKLSFDSTLLRLRRLIGHDGAIELKSGVVRLNRSIVWTDVAALDELLTAIENDAAAGAAERSESALERVLALYRGPFLPTDDQTAALVATRDRIRARVLRVASQVGMQLEAADRHAVAARLYARVLEQDVLAEEIYRRLIVCQLALGQQAEAYDTFRRCRDNLSIILGIKPSPATQALVARLRAA